MARILQTISPAQGSGSKCLDILSHLPIFVTSQQSSSRSFPAPLELPSRRGACGGLSQRGKTMRSDGKSDAICWRVTTPAGPARLLCREEEDSLSNGLWNFFSLGWEADQRLPIHPVGRNERVRDSRKTLAWQSRVSLPCKSELPSLCGRDAACSPAPANRIPSRRACKWSV